MEVYMSKDEIYQCKICKKERAIDSESCPHCGTKEVHWSVHLHGFLSEIPTYSIRE